MNEALNELVQEDVWDDVLGLAKAGARAAVLTMASDPYAAATIVSQLNAVFNFLAGIYDHAGVPIPSEIKKAFLKE